MSFDPNQIIDFISEKEAKTGESTEIIINRIAESLNVTIPPPLVERHTLDPIVQRNDDKNARKEPSNKNQARVSLSLLLPNSIECLSPSANEPEIAENEESDDEECAYPFDYSFVAQMIMKS